MLRASREVLDFRMPERAFQTDGASRQEIIGGHQIDH